ncbi:MAG: type VI-D CRISPR-associated RNA-guided ribonuclease Cas13d, partial [Planctomycetaceae bacterium]|nr:type VI-D CRISPR-associated RNA-guided ribonuclease Cas13d [Planctomycetaceae bacterium]
IDVKGKDYQGNALEALLNNPAEHAGEDYLKLKPLLEKEFFGKEFPNDNIRIQIIHNILDIQKILGLYVTDIIYSINNLQADLETIDEKERDIVGLAMNNDKKVNERLNRISSYFGFFGDAFILTPKPDKNKKGQVKNQSEIDAGNAHNVSVLRALGAIRQATAHFKNFNIPFSKYDDMKKVFKKDFKVEWDIFDNLYAKRIEDINDTFIEHSAKNLNILFDSLGAKSYNEKQHIAGEYYNFTILKQGKNLGVNMKQLREFMIKKYYGELNDEKHNSYRQKIYAVTDYILFRELYQSNELEEMVANLRETTNDDAKKNLYEGFAETVWSKVQDILLPFFQLFNGDFPKLRSEELPESLIDEVKLNTKKTIPFVQMISFMCNFLDGKEINELLTAYIHKFENIQTFIDTIKGLGEQVAFTKKYDLFNDYSCKRAGSIAEQLRILASIGKMKGDLSDVKRPLYKAAIRTLGIEKLEFENDDEKFNKWLEDNVITGDGAKKKDCNPFRNFIAKQVIKSNRFIYLVRYTRPQTVRALMQNQNIVRYVLTRLPEKQIDKYYKLISNGNEKELSDKIGELTVKLSNLSFQSLVNSKGKIKDASSQPGKRNVEIEKLKGLVGLYLTVAFVAIKQLVKTNARYYIAFAVFDRDFHLFKEKFKDDTNFKHTIGNFDNYFAITEYFLDEDDKVRYVPDPNLSDVENKKALFKFLDTRAGKWHFTKKWNSILRDNISEAKKIQDTGGLLVEVRNHAEHLNVLMNLTKYIDDFRKNSKEPMQSYFELYHYVLQRMMIQANSQSWNIGEFADKINKFHTPSHDLIKYAYVSLAYNLPRYKNLTVEALFDDDSEAGKELNAKWKQKENEKEKK